MPARLFFRSLIFSALSTSAVCDTALYVQTDYYISSKVNPNFISNLVGFEDGNSNYPGIGKDEGGTFSYARWKLTSVSGQAGYTLSTDNNFVLDIMGGTSSSPNNPVPFLNTVLDSTLDGQSSWYMHGATESDLPNADNGFWTPIINTAWKLALRAPDEGSAESEACDLAETPSGYDTGRYWFFASVTRSPVTTTISVTEVTTSTGDTSTQTINQDGPISTITSTIIKTLTTTIEITSTAAPGRLAERYDFVTPTSTFTSTFWLTSTVAGPVISVTKQGGFVYTTAYVTSSFYVTKFSTIIETPSASAEGTQTTAPVLPTGDVTGAATKAPTVGTSTQLEDSTNSSGTPSSPSSSSTSSGAAPSAASNADKSTDNHKSSSNKVAAIVGGTLGGVILIILALLAAWWYRRRQRRTSTGEAPPIYTGRHELAHDSVAASSYFRDSAPIATSPPLRNSTPASWGNVSSITQEKQELGATGIRRVEAPEMTDRVQRGGAARHEMEGVGANMNNGPRYEMDGRNDWR